MDSMIFGFVALFAFLFLLYNNAKLLPLAITLGIALFLFGVSQLVIGLYMAVVVILIVKPIRTSLISRPIVNIISKLHLLPTISDTEKTALRAGTVWVDGEIFSGKPNFTTMLNDPYPTLTTEEKNFIDNEVNEVCKMTNDYQTFHDRDLSKEVWDYLKKKKFFGMIIPKQYGGLGFSALGHSEVILKLASHSQPLAITTMVPNSLGPAELLLHYGTDKQREYYLPRLANGEEIPCFALTEPLAGSDATSIRSYGEVFKEGDDIKIRLNFEKRYITLGSIATLIGLAFHLRDPENILGDNEDLGITCALVKSTLDGIVQNNRHNPLGVPFINSPLFGKDVVISIDDVIGGLEGVGGGWKMLMESLAVGRGISLPSTCTGGMKLSLKATSAYSMVREQFGIPIGRFEGIQDKLGHISAMTYMIDSARCFAIGAIDAGKKPSVINAVMKYHATELFRDTINDAMDIVGGSGISLGEKNILGHAYMSAPIAITVEGANIMTRTLIQFGQGVIRCHPYAYKEISALEGKNVDDFDTNFFAHVGFVFSNLVRSIAFSLTRGYIHLPVSKRKASYFERKLMWSSAVFALFTDIAMGYFGGQLKQKESLSARFADVLSYTYLLIATIRRYKEDGYKKEYDVYMEYIGNYCLSNIQSAYDELFENMFASNKVLYILFSPFRLFARLNKMGKVTNDKHLFKIIKDILDNSDVRTELTEGVYESKQIALLEEGFSLHLLTNPTIGKIKKAIRNGSLPKLSIELLVDSAQEKGIITDDEASLLQKAISLKNNVVQVDYFNSDNFTGL